MSDNILINAVKHNSWYIINALMYKIENLEESISDGKKSLENDDGTVIYKSVRNMINYCEQSLKEHKKALDSLREAGLE